MFLQYVFVQSVFITTFECLYSLKYKLKERQHQTFHAQQASVKKYRFRFGLAMFFLIAFDIAVVSTIQSIYLSEVITETQTEAVLPPYLEYVLQGMLLIFIILYICFRFCINGWFEGESRKTQAFVRRSSSKFIGIFVLQGVCILSQSVLCYVFIYRNHTSPYAHIVFQLSLNVFPIFGTLIPSAFIIYTHYANLKEDANMIDESYNHYKSITVDVADTED